MSDFVTALVDLLPMHNNLQKTNNVGRKVLDDTIGEWFDNHDVVSFYNNLFLQQATGKYLDLFGKDYNVIRQNGESDDDYRNRLIISSLKHLTPSYLKTLYDLDLYVGVNGFSISMNDLTSDNAYINQYGYMVENTNGVMNIINDKFVIDANVFWIIDEQATQYILDTDDNNILPTYRNVYNLTDCSEYFKSNYTIKSVKLELSNATNCEKFIYDCYNLNSVDLSLPNATNCKNLLKDCYFLEDMNLNLPSTTNCDYLCTQCFGLTEVELSLPSATSCDVLFEACVNMTSIKLDLPVVTDMWYSLSECRELTDVEVNMPNVSDYSNFLKNSTKLERIKLSVPTSEVEDMTTYIQSLNLQYLESLIINGEEVEI